MHKSWLQSTVFNVLTLGYAPLPAQEYYILLFDSHVFDATAK